jgi:hypothetical protein
MASLRDLSASIEDFRNKQNAITTVDKKHSKYVQTSKARSYPDIDMTVVGMRQPALSGSSIEPSIVGRKIKRMNAPPSNEPPNLIGGGRKVKRMNAPPQVKKALKSVGKATVKAAASVGKDALGVVTQTSSQMAAKAPDMIESAVMSGGKEKTVRKPSPWIEHVRSYAKQHNISYKDAMSAAKASYKK